MPLPFLILNFVLSSTALLFFINFNHIKWYILINIV